MWLQVLDYIEDIGLEEIAYSPFLAPYSHRVFHYIGFQTKKIEILCVSFTGNSDLGCDYVLSGCESICKLEIWWQGFVGQCCNAGDDAISLYVLLLSKLWCM